MGKRSLRAAKKNYIRAYYKAILKKKNIRNGIMIDLIVGFLNLTV